MFNTSSSARSHRKSLCLVTESVPSAQLGPVSKLGFSQIDQRIDHVVLPLLSGRFQSGD